MVDPIVFDDFTECFSVAVSDPPKLNRGSVVSIDLQIAAEVTFGDGWCSRKVCNINSLIAPSNYPQLIAVIFNASGVNAKWVRQKSQ